MNILCKFLQVNPNLYDFLQKTKKDNFENVDKQTAYGHQTTETFLQISYFFLLDDEKVNK